MPYPTACFPCLPRHLVPFVASLHTCRLILAPRSTLPRHQNSLPWRLASLLLCSPFSCRRPSCLFPLSSSCPWISPFPMDCIWCKEDGNMRWKQISSKTVDLSFHQDTYLPGEIAKKPAQAKGAQRTSERAPVSMLQLTNHEYKPPMVNRVESPQIMASL